MEHMLVRNVRDIMNAAFKKSMFNIACDWRKASNAGTKVLRLLCIMTMNVTTQNVAI